jgi:hypothetical protein
MIEFCETENGTDDGTASGTAFRLINWAKFQHRGTANGTGSGTADGTLSGNLLIRSNTRSINTRNIKQEPLKPPKRRSRFLSVNGEKSHELGDTDWMEIDFSKED